MTSAVTALQRQREERRGRGEKGERREGGEERRGGGEKGGGGYQYISRQRGTCTVQQLVTSKGLANIVEGRGGEVAVEKFAAVILCAE